MFVENHSLRSRLAEGFKESMLLLLLSSTIWGLSIGRPFAADSIDHPYVDTKDLRSETCLKCHPTKNQGKFVHTAVGTGCDNCHQIASADNKTTITLIAAGGDLCAKCHELKKDPVLHGPYKAGECLICHNPHTGAYPAQTRAAVNALCLSCHILNQPEARVNAQTKMVSLLDGRVYDLASWESAPKIGVAHSENYMPGRASDPVTAKKPGKNDAVVNCLSCHDPHVTKAEHSQRKAAEGRGAAENLSPGYHGDCARVNGGPQNVPVLQAPFLEGRL
jgi:predicted CXXCH cytochrome family protein